MQTNPAAEYSKIVRSSASPCNQSGRKGKGLRMRKGFAEEPTFWYLNINLTVTTENNCHITPSQLRERTRIMGLFNGEKAYSLR